MIIICSVLSCGSRKVAVNNTKTSEKSETKLQLKDSVSQSAQVVDKSTFNKVTKELAKTIEESDFTATADSGTYNPKTGNMSLKGNVKLTGKGKKQSDLQKDINEQLQADLTETYQAAEIKDLSVIDKSEKKADLHNRDSDAKRGFNWWMALAVIGVGVVAFFALRASWLK